MAAPNHCTQMMMMMMLLLKLELLLCGGTQPLYTDDDVVVAAALFGGVVALWRHPTIEHRCHQSAARDDFFCRIASETVPLLRYPNVNASHIHTYIPTYIIHTDIHTDI